MEKKNSPLERVTAAGGVLLRQKETGLPPEVLLIYRRGIWDLPKGKLEQGETIKACASREVSEEVGLSTLPEIESFLIKTYHEYQQESILFGKETHWFTMSLSKPITKFKPEQEEGIERVAWCPLGRAKKKVGYKNLEDVLNTLEGKL